MSPSRILLSVLVFPLLFAGCFEIREEVDLNADGTGRFTYTLNLSESKANLANYMRLGTFNDRKVPTRQEIEEEIASVKKTLAACKGITEVRSYSNFEDFIFSFSARFDNVQNLNAALNKITATMEQVPGGGSQLRNFTYTAGAFRRYFEYPIGDVDYSQLTSMQRYMLEEARMVSVYRFQQPIREYSNPNAQMAPNRRAIKLEVPLGSAIKGGGTLANSILF